MLFAALFFIELFILFLLSRILTSSLSIFFFRIIRSKRFTIYLLAFLFFPGTLLHEVAHAAMARLLFVPVYHIEFLPKLEGDSVKLGSVSIAKTDHIRRLLIGMAPFLIGTISLLFIFFFTQKNQLFINAAVDCIVGYVAFEISNTMFSSKKDLEGAIELLLILFLVVGLLYLLGFRLPEINPTAYLNSRPIRQAFEKGDFFLSIPLFIDATIIGLIKLFLA